MTEFLGSFIEDQRIRRLRVPEGNESELLAWFQGRGTRDVARSAVERELITEGDVDLEIGELQREQDNLDRFWPAEPDRTAFLCDLAHKRICFSIDAGVGKSIVVHQLEYVTQCMHPKHLVMRFELKSVPEEAAQLVTQERGDGKRPLLIQTALNRFEKLREAKHSGRLPSPDRAEAYVRAQLRRGNVTLIFDAIDQLPFDLARKRAAVIRTFLETYPHTRCVIAGRPCSIQEIWGPVDGLHLGELSGPVHGKQKPVWQFLRIDRYERDHVRRYLGKTRLEAAVHLDLDEIRVPRTANVVRKASLRVLRQMESNSDLYYYTQFESLNESIQHQFRDGTCPFIAKEIMQIVAAVSFGLWSWKEQPVMYAPCSGERSDSYDSFRRHLTDIGLEARLSEDGIVLKEALNTLASINTDAVRFDPYTRTGSGVIGLEMSDATVRDFYAALWAARYMDSETARVGDELAWQMQQRLLSERMSRISLFGDSFHPLCRPMWKLLIGFRDRTFSELHPTPALEVSYVRSIAPLFRRPPNIQPRPTELMYLGWVALLSWCGRLPELNAQCSVLERFGITEEEMGEHFIFEPELTAQLITDELQQDVQRLFHENVSLQRPIETAEDLLIEFLREFLRLVALGDSVAGAFDRGFSQIPKGMFRWADNEMATAEIRRPFALHRFQVSNEIYDRFDSQHRVGYSRYLYPNRTDSVSPYPQGAAVHKSWFDATMFAIWAHGRLPSCSEWEAACRGRIGELSAAHSNYYFGDDPGELDQHCWYKQNSSRTEDDVNRGPHAHTVGLLREAGAMHPYGLFDILGNVREWTSSRVRKENPFARDVCGGSFIDSPLLVTCDSDEVVSTHYDKAVHGFRVARTQSIRS